MTASTRESSASIESTTSIFHAGFDVGAAALECRNDPGAGDVIRARRIVEELRECARVGRVESDDADTNRLGIGARFLRVPGVTEQKGGSTRERE
jgi:hypothetical protein